MKRDYNDFGIPRESIVCNLYERGHTVKHPQGDYKSTDIYRITVYDLLGNISSSQPSWRWGDDVADLMRKYPDYKVFLNNSEVK